MYLLFCLLQQGLLDAESEEDDFFLK